MHSISTWTLTGQGPVCSKKTLLRLPLLACFFLGSFLFGQYGTCLSDTLPILQSRFEIGIHKSLGSSNSWKIEGGVSKPNLVIKEIIFYFLLGKGVEMTPEISFSPGQHPFNEDEKAFWNYHWNPLSGILMVQGIRPLCEGRAGEGLLFSLDLTLPEIPIIPRTMPGGLVIADVAIGIKRDLPAPRLSPNPATTYINLPANQASNSAYRVFNRTGQTVMEGTIQELGKKRLYIHRLKPGFYWISMENPQGNPVISSFIKQM